ncbi:MAG TPA: formyltransferase family protein [Allosphingosinicella sp.]|jgi:methionyl-tRNA formyltransferase
MTPERSLVFLGSKAAGLRACRALAALLPAGRLEAIVCPEDRADPRSVYEEFDALAKAHGIPIYVVPNRRETMTLLERLEPETAIVHGWYQILDVASLPGTTFLGFHYSPLPRYRGNAPLVWQIIQGESEIGVSFFELTAEMDAGRLIDQKTATLGTEETIADALDKADALALDMLGDFVPTWLEGTVELRPQPEGEPSYCAMRVPEDGRIDWSWPGDRIHDFIRAQTRPYPGAFTILPDGRRLMVYRSARETRRFMGAPGSVAEISAGHVVIAAGEGAVRLIEAAVEGEGAQPAASLIRSLKTRLG